jgi:hypothetical protein
VPFGIALIDRSAWSHSWTRSRRSLERILPPEFITRLPNLNPILVRNFVLADMDARKDGRARFPGGIRVVLQPRGSRSSVLAVRPATKTRLPRIRSLILAISSEFPSAFSSIG